MEAVLPFFLLTVDIFGLKNIYNKLRVRISKPKSAKGPTILTYVLMFLFFLCCYLIFFFFNFKSKLLKIKNSRNVNVDNVHLTLKMR